MSITLKKGEIVTLADEQENELLSIDFDLDPGNHLIGISVYDTDGYPVLDLSVNYLGAGYPQCGAGFVNRIERSSLPRRSPQPPFKVVEQSKRINSKRRELDPDDPKTETWCSIARKED